MDEARYIALCEENLAVFYRMAYSIVSNRADAEDAVQQALMKAWQHRKKAHPGKEKAWMMRILVNECYTLLRQRRTLPLEDAADVPAPNEQDDGLREALNALPEKLRTPLLLKYMAGMTEREAADALHLTVSGLKNRLFRARRQLKTLLNEEASP